VQLLGGQNIAAQLFDQRSDQAAGLADPLGQRRTVEVDALAGIDIGLPVKRQVIAKLGRQDMGQQPGAGESAVDGTGRQSGARPSPTCARTASSAAWRSVADDARSRCGARAVPTAATRSAPSTPQAPTCPGPAA
jgi:hypothetical protein